ncbi:MAG: hypothetical protein ACBR12_17600, partial [Microcoleus sp.]
ASLGGRNKNPPQPPPRGEGRSRLLGRKEEEPPPAPPKGGRKKSPPWAEGRRTPPAPPKGGRKKSPPWAEGRSRHPSFLVKNPVAGLSLTNCWIIFINLTITLIGQSTGN